MRSWYGMNERPGTDWPLILSWLGAILFCVCCWLTLIWLANKVIGGWVG